MRNRIFGIRNADCGMRNLKGDIENNGLLEWWDGGTIKRESGTGTGGLG